MLTRTFSLSGALALACLLSASLTAEDTSPPSSVTTASESAVTFFNPECKRCHFCPTRSDSESTDVEREEARFLFREPGLE